MGFQSRRRLKGIKVGLCEETPFDYRRETLSFRRWSFLILKLSPVLVRSEEGRFGKYLRKVERWLGLAEKSSLVG